MNSMKWKRAIFATLMLCALFAVGVLTKPTPSSAVLQTNHAESSKADPTKELIAETQAVPKEQQQEAEITKPIETPKPTLFETLAAEARTILENQQKVDSSLAEEMASHAYTWDDPFVLVNPYGNSPLTAIALFETEIPVQVSVHISGKTKLADVDFTFSEYRTQHIIPIYGLYPDTLNKIELRAKAKDASLQTQILELQTEPLAGKFEEIGVITDLRNATAYQAGFNFLYRQYKAAYDVAGDFRWYLNDLGFSYHQPDYNGHLLLPKGGYFAAAVLIYEYDYLGRVYNVYYSPYGFHHDLVGIENGNILVTGSNFDNAQDFIYEINALTGQIENTLDLKSILQRTRSLSWIPEITDHENDWFHLNSIVSDGMGNIVISGRNQSAVVKLSWPEGKIDWILSTHNDWNEMFKKYLLNPIGNIFEWPSAQHNPTILPDYDNNPDTIDILLFDNGTGRFLYDSASSQKADRVDISQPTPYTRIVHYRINEKTNTIEQIWQFGKELGERYYARMRGNAMLLANGNVLASFDVGKQLAMTGTEYVYANTCFEVSQEGDIVWESYLFNRNSSSGDFPSYRTNRALLYSDRDNSYSFDIAPGNFIPESETK